MFKKYNILIVQVKRISWVALLLFCLASCRDTFEHSPYSAQVPEEYSNQRQANFDKLNLAMPDPSDSSAFKIALISDSHTWFDHLEDAIDAVNKDNEISFILHGGDMTDGGMLMEYLLFQEIMNKANAPFFTVVGNHDCLANGLEIYEDMFGPDEYTLIAGNCKFIFFNDISWELEHRELNFSWLTDELSDHYKYSHVFVVAHIPPYSDSFTSLQEHAYTVIMDTNDVSISVHGHMHGYSLTDFYDDGMKYMTIGSVSERYYITMSIDPDTVRMEKVHF